MTISLIVAMSQNRVIGRAGQLPWHMPADLRRFKQLTMGHTMIMGRKTFESIGRALPGRKSIVVTRSDNLGVADVLVASSLDKALELAHGDPEVFVIGGEQLFREALPRADRIYLTQLLGNVEGDVYFPRYDEAEWELAEESFHPADEKNPYAHRFLVYNRQRAPGETSTVTKGSMDE